MTIFKLRCPKCRAKDKLIGRCLKCHGLCCINCSIESLCIDCYIKIRKDKEINIYYKERERSISCNGLTY